MTDKVNINIQDTTMMNFIKTLISKIMNGFFDRTVFEKKSMKTIDFSDALTGVSDLIALPDDLGDDFKCFSSMDDYNKDFLTIFQTYRTDIFLDYSQKDGHFRV